ncbi:hypothetical protein B8V81_3046 [Paenibacillus pasadenensis]|uniref:N-acetyltransferase domain-containing protein n=2 Tax=Paenibacillus TaxID=44249 RepID=A0A2N5N2Q9_9BACL|nr:hypothetical protein B8V81_3046 [Paenibacillus pasadenensis]
MLDSQVRMAIEFEGRLIGYADLAQIRTNAAELGISIGESGLWGKGIGSLAAGKMMELAREKYGITLFNAETNEENARSRRMLEKLGFVEISRVGREAYLGKDGRLIQYRLGPVIEQ